jgi:hypothetical protein
VEATVVKKLLIVTAFALLVGAATGYWLGSGSDAPGIDPRFLENRPQPAISRLPTVSDADAEASRRAGYKDVDSVASAMALPTYFARKEAIYVLAGRSTSAELQDLLFQAVSIANSSEKGNVIRTLLERLVEIDPKSAVAIAESPALTAEGQYVQQTWFFWARHDLSAALEDASSRKRDTVRIAQALYTAMPIPEQAVVDQIRAALGHRPDRQTISYWVRSMYRRSPLEAAAYVNGMSQRGEQHNAVQSMAYYLAPYKHSEAMQFATMLNSAELRQAFENTLNVQIASKDPVRALQMMLDGRSGKRNSAAIEPAMRYLVATDPGRLDAIIAQLSERDQQIAVSVAATTMAETDPDQALEWIRDRGEPHAAGALNEVLAVIARKDPDRAISEALNLPQRGDRDGALGAIARAMLADDPVRAMSVLEEISDPSSQKMYFNQTMTSWIRRDAANAIAWYNSLPAGRRDMDLRQALEQLAWSQPEAVTDLLPELSPEDARTGRHAVAQALLGKEGFDASMRFIKQYANEDDYPDLKRLAYFNLAQQEPNRALQLMQQEADGDVRDAVLAVAAGSIARYDPRRALGIATQVESQAHRSEAHRTIVQSWLSSDPQAATSWISSQPPGAEKDQLLTTAAYTAMQRDIGYVTGLVEQIADPDVRRNTVTSVARQVYIRQSADKARRILEEAGLSPQERADMEEQFERMKAQMHRPGVYRYQ